MQSWNRYIKDFVSYLKIEKGLADNSDFAYQNDVKIEVVGDGGGGGGASWSAHDIANG